MSRDLCWSGILTRRHRCPHIGPSCPGPAAKHVHYLLVNLQPTFLQLLSPLMGATAYMRIGSNLSFIHQIPKSRVYLMKCCASLSASISLAVATSTIYRRNIAAKSATQIENSVTQDSLFSGLEDVMMGYVSGKTKATLLAHSVWKNIVRKGDTVIDATCGNGYDTLAMLKMVSDSTRKGRVYALDVQKVALENTQSLLDRHVSPQERELVELFAMCHSQMEDVVPQGISARLVAFNLGYLPGGNKKVITKSDTTLLALEAAERILAPRGLISVLVYVGHHGGREEYDIVQSFATGLPVEKWICCKLEMLNRPSAPVLVLLVKK